MKSYLLAIMAAGALGAQAADFIPTRLRVEHMENPTTVDTRTPRLSWVNTPTDSRVKDARQSAYRIVVSTSAKKLASGKYDVWDSGKIPSGESYLVEYKGTPLADGADYYWKVQTWDGSGESEGWSDTATFGMGLLTPGRWSARWIGAPWQGETPRKYLDPAKGVRDYPAPLLRREFPVKGKVKSAKAFVTGLGYFELRLNGKKVGDDLLVPNFTNYTKRNDLDKYGIVIDDDFNAYRVMYLAYDLTPMLRQGENVVGAILGNGFYDATTGWISPFGSPRFLCQIEIAYEDGSRETIVTDDTWRAARSGITFNDPFDGEIYDSRLESAGWDTPGYDDSGWMRAAYREAPTGELTPHMAPTDKVTASFAPVSVERQADGSWEVAYPVEISGWIRLNDLDMKANDTIDIKYYCDQHVGVHRYVAREDGKVNHSPRFTWYVFSKARIKGVDDLKPENIVAEAVNTDLPVAARFHASNLMLDSINTIWRRSQEDNLHGGIASDCPHRERAPYTGDGQVAINTVMANYDAAAFYRKWIRDMRDAQNRKTGYVPNGAPWQPGCGGGVAWGAAMNVMPWEYYRHYGDRAMLEENYPAMKAQVQYMLGWLTPDGTMLAKRGNDNDPNHTPTYWLNLGDWCAPYELPSEELVHTFYLWRCLDYTSRAAHALGLYEDQMKYATLAGKAADSFHRKFYNPEAKSYGDYGANVFALEIGVPDSIAAAVASTLAHEVGELHNGHLHTGIFATRYLFEQLGKTGSNDLAYQAMTARGYPGFGHWLDQGATVTWEKWNGQDSRNHPMFGGALMWFYNTLAGVSPDESGAGYRSFTVKPHPAAGLDNVSYSLDTPYGEAASEVSYAPGETRLKVTVPVGSRAEVWVPLPTADAKVSLGDGSAVKGKKSADGRWLITQAGQGTMEYTAR